MVFFFLVWQIFGAFMVAPTVKSEHASGIRNISEGDFSWSLYVVFIIVGVTVWPIPKFFPKQTYKFMHWLV